MADSIPQTLKHISLVQKRLTELIANLITRSGGHDMSKLQEPEKTTFDAAEEAFARVAYGSQEYYEHLESIRPAIEHHYKHNDHHPDHYSQSEFPVPDQVILLHHTLHRLIQTDPGDPAHQGLQNALLNQITDLYDLVDQVLRWYQSPVRGMSLPALCELLADWTASAERDGNPLYSSITIGSSRYHLCPQMLSALENTARDLGWFRSTEPPDLADQTGQ